MKLNIELIRKKDTANVLDFEYELEDAEKSGLLGILSAERVGRVRISGDAAQENGFAAINYDIDADFTVECARCGRETAQRMSLGGKKYLADKADGKEDNDDYYTLESPGIVDLHEFAAEFLALEAPLRYLCSDDCLGLCEQCGKDLNAGGCACGNREINPAFKVLDNFFD